MAAMKDLLRESPEALTRLRQLLDSIDGPGEPDTEQEIAAWLDSIPTTTDQEDTTDGNIP